MTNSSPIDRLHEESSAIIELLSKDETSLAIAAGDNFRKTLLLAAASYFEHRICTCVSDFVHERSNGDTMVVGFLKNKAIARQYHTWFNWKETNANQFFGLFGEDFKQMMTKQVKASQELSSSIQAFLEIGAERNKLVHQDFASFSLNKTLNEIYDLYRLSLVFVDGLSTYLRECKPSAT